jgi:hypothetical protein
LADLQARYPDLPIDPKDPIYKDPFYQRNLAQKKVLEEALEKARNGKW